MAYQIVMEQTGNGFSAYVPDLPGCVAAGETREETEALLLEAIERHLEALALRRNLAFGLIGNAAYMLGGTTAAAVATGQREFLIAPEAEYYKIPA